MLYFYSYQIKQLLEKSLVKAFARLYSYGPLSELSKYRYLLVDIRIPLYLLGITDIYQVPLSTTTYMPV